MEIIAHRGCAGMAPENTITAAQKGLSAGADLWETDIAVTRDDRLVLLHDSTLARTTNASRRFPKRRPWRVSDFTFEEICSLDAGSWFVESDPFGVIRSGRVSPEEALRFRGIRIPSLEDALRFTESANWGINLEIKKLSRLKADFPIAETTLACIRNTGVQKDRIRISSFEHHILRDTRRIDPEINLQALLGRRNIHNINWDDPEFQTYNIDALLITPPILQAAERSEIVINAYTVNRPDEAERLFKKGVAGVFTDFPQRIRQENLPA